MGWIVWAAVLWGTPALSWSGQAQQDPVRDEARQLAYEGIKALRAEQYTEALSLLRQAEQRFHAPTHLLYMARAHVGLGDLIAAHDEYVAIAIEPIPNYAAAAFHQARREAAVEVQQLRARVATLRVDVEGAQAASVSVTVDDQAVEAARLAHPIAVAAGEHRITAVGAGGVRAEQVATVAAGESKTVTLSLEGESVPPSDSGAPAPAPDSADGSGLTVAGAVLVAVGGAALVVGGITGGMTLSRAGDIEDTCGGDVCPTTEEPTVDDAKTLGNVSTAMLIVGGVVAATGVVLLVVAPGDEAEAATAKGPRLELRATAFGASLAGVF
jgi:hypothetical protein